jgi:hypothetical protein
MNVIADKDCFFANKAVLQQQICMGGDRAVINPRAPEPEEYEHKVVLFLAQVRHGSGIVVHNCSHSKLA